MRSIGLAVPAGFVPTARLERWGDHGTLPSRHRRSARVGGALRPRGLRVRLGESAPGDGARCPGGHSPSALDRARDGGAARGHGSTEVSVTDATLRSIEVRPTDPTFAAGTSVPLDATGTFSDETKQTLTEQVGWSSSEPDVATVSNAAGSEGLATGVGRGTAKIAAARGGVRDETVLTVTRGELESIAVAPAAASLGVGETIRLSAIGTFAEGDTLDITASVAWSSSDRRIVRVANAARSRGEIEGVAPGVATISAKERPIEGRATATVP